MKKTLLIIGTIVLMLLTGLSGYTFNNRLALPYNSKGSYYDFSSGIVYHQQSVEVYAVITFVLFSLTILTGFYTVKSFRKSRR